MMISQEELEQRLQSPDNLVNIMRDNPEHKSPSVTVTKWQGWDGRKEVGTPNLTDEERLAAGVLGRTVGNEIAAEVIGCSKQSVSNFINGNNGSSQELANKIDEAVGRTVNKAEEVAAERLLEALGLMTVDKMSTCSAKDLSTIASNMSRTVQGLRPNTDNKSGVKVQIIMHQPKPAREEHFEVIEVSA